VDTPHRHSLRDEIADLERGREFLSSSCPHLAPDIENVVDAAVAGLEDLEEIPPAPTHLDFAFDHIMVKGDRLALIDLDGLADADPVMDVAIVLAHLSTHSLISALPRDRALEAGRVFVEEYFARVPESWYTRLPLLYASALTKTAAGIIRTHQANWPEKIELLLDEAKDSLAGKIW
jgi:aminoglycoside phosphotransferase (APT) family kinase protein